MPENKLLLVKKPRVQDHHRRNPKLIQDMELLSLLFIENQSQKQKLQVKKLQKQKQERRQQDQQQRNQGQQLQKGVLQPEEVEEVNQS